MSRGSRFSSILQWFREDGSVDEVRAIMPLCLEAVQTRTAPKSSKSSKSSGGERTKSARSLAAKQMWERRRLNEAKHQQSDTNTEEAVTI
jgi:hypothetical protein